MKIIKRMEVGTGEKRWSQKTINQDTERCDECGAQLWIDPSGTVYCDMTHRLPPSNDIQDSSQLP